MITVAVINQKGGVGKSTTALALGRGLARLGKRVLLVDLDPQANLTYAVKGNLSGLTALDVLDTPATMKNAVQQTAQGALLASHPRLAGADKLFDTTGKEYRLREALTEIAADYDYAVIDTPPALGILTVNALTACTGAIIPAQADMFSLSGIVQLADTVETVRKYCNPSLTVYGILLTRYNGRSTVRRDIAQMTGETARRFNTVVFRTHIRECVSIVEAQALQTDLYTYAPKSNAVRDYTAFTAEFTEVSENG